MLDNGLIYQLGRDNKYRPLIIISLNQIEDLRANEASLLEAFVFIITMVRVKMLLPYHVEKWNLLVDTNDVSVLKNIDEFLNKVYNIIQNHFPQTINKIYLLNVSILDDFSKRWNRKEYFVIDFA